MNMKPPIFCLSLLLLFCGALPAQQKWDLKRSVDYALTNNISIKQQDVQARFSKLTYNQSRLSRYPYLNFGNNFGLSTGRSVDRTTNQFTTETVFYTGFSLQTNVDLFSFFTKQNTIAANNYNLQAAEASVDKLKNDVALNVAGAYLQVLLNREQLEISRVQLKQTEAQLTNTQKLVQAGAVPELAAAELEAQLARDSSNVVTAKGAEAQSLLFLKALLSLDAGAPFDIVTPPIETIPVEPLSELQLESVYGLALKNLPQQRVNSLLLKGAQKNVDAAKGALYPSLSVGANLQTNYSNSKNQAEFLNFTNGGLKPVGIVHGTTDTVFAPVLNPNYRLYSDPLGRQFVNNFGNSIGFSINVPIFNGGAARTAWQRAKLNVQTYELQQDLDNLTLKQDIYRAYTDAVTSLEKFNAATKGVETSQKASDFSEKRYNIGLLNTLELLTTQSNLFRARLERVAAQFDYVFKMKVLEFYKGQGLRL